MANIKRNLSVGIVCILIVVFGFSYIVFNGAKFNEGVTPSVVQIDPSQCRLSMLESDDWFCELNNDWNRRKSIDRIQHRRNRNYTSRELYFQGNWEPTIQCEFERRIGNVADGGKWVCDIHRFEQLKTPNILVYSFGSNGDFSFEQAVKEQIPSSEIHTFDMGVFQCPFNVCTYHQARIGNGKTNISKSLGMLMNELGHQKRHIHILKVDIEGGEFDLFEELFDLSKDRTTIPYIRQILFEIHIGGDPTDGPVNRTDNLFKLFRSNNYAIYHKEPNIYDGRNILEYALLKLNVAFFNSAI